MEKGTQNKKRGDVIQCQKGPCRGKDRLDSGGTKTPRFWRIWGAFMGNLFWRVSFNVVWVLRVGMTA